MTTILLITAILIIPRVTIMLMRWAKGVSDSQINDQRRKINATFLSRTIYSADKTLAFHPAAARLVHEEETVRGSHAVVVTANHLYTNEFGEYFLFICTAEDQGFIKRLTIMEARNMLAPHKKVFDTEFGLRSSEIR